MNFSNSGNPLEILGLLDIIKNEKFYTEKLEELKTEYRKLQDSKFIVATVEQANKIMEDAKAMKEEYGAKLEDLEGLISVRVEEERQELANLRQAVKAERTKLQEWADQLKGMQERVVNETDAMIKRRGELQAYNGEVTKRGEEVRAQELLLAKKVKLIKEVFERNE